MSVVSVLKPEGEYIIVIQCDSVRHPYLETGILLDRVSEMMMLVMMLMLLMMMMMMMMTIIIIIIVIVITMLSFVCVYVKAQTDRREGRGGANRSTQRKK